MNPFDQPPVGPPMSMPPGPPTSPPPSGSDGPIGPRRGRGGLIVAALASAAVLTGGVVVASQFASADDPVVSTATAPPGEPDDEDGEEGEPGQGDLGSVLGGLGLPACFDDLFGDMQLPALDEGSWEDLEDEFDLEEFDLGEFDLDGLLEDLPFGGDSVTVTGPDGVEIIEFGEGDGSVTVTREDGELRVETEGDVEVTDLETWFEDFDLGDLGLGDLDLGGLERGEFDPDENFDFGLGDGDLEAWTDCFGEFDLGDFDLGEFDFDFEVTPPTEG